MQYRNESEESYQNKVINRNQLDKKPPINIKIMQNP